MKGDLKISTEGANFHKRSDNQSAVFSMVNQNAAFLVVGR